MQKISLIALVFVLIACSVPAPVIPTAPVTLTVSPTGIPTSIPTLTVAPTSIPTSIPTLTETATPVPEVAGMENVDFDTLKLNEPIRVLDIYGEGAGTLTFLAEEMAAADKTFDLQPLEALPTTSPRMYSVSGPVVVGRLLYQIDLEDNTILADGTVAKVTFEFLDGKGNKVRYSMFSLGKVSNGTDGQMIYERFQIGVSIKDLQVHFSDQILTRTKMREAINLSNIEEDQIPSLYFAAIGRNLKKFTWNNILTMIRGGEQIDLDEARFW